jgi:glycosyltransferase involved in cell wall biosynthesis
MKFSILINNYNNEPYLKECLESVLHQSRPADEIVVVDDGSTDESRRLIEEYATRFPAVKPVYQKNGGQISAVTTGISSSSGDVLFFLDGDDAYKLNHLESIEKYWKKYPHIDFIYSRSDLINQSSLSDSQIEEHKKNTCNLVGPVENILEPYECGCSAALACLYPWYYMGNTTSTLSLKRNHAASLGLEQIANNNPFQVGNADYALLLKSALHLGRKLYVPDETVLYRIHENSITRKSSKQGSDLAFNHYRWLMRLGFLKHYCLKDFPPLLKSFDFEVIEEEIKTIPNPSRAHLEYYKIATKLAQGRTHELEETIKKREAHLQSLYNSLSWRVTKPLRILENIVLAVLK